MADMGASGAGYGPGSGASRAAAPPAFDTALAQYRAGMFDAAAGAFDALAPGDTKAELWAARAVREGKGCGAAVGSFDHFAQRAAGTLPAWDALLEGALCYRTLSNFGEARTRLRALLTVDSHKDRARAELDRLDRCNRAAKAAGPATSTPPAANAAPAAAPAAAAPAPPGSSSY